MDAPVHFDADDALLAIVLRIETEHGAVRDLRTYIEAVPEGWWYSAPLPGSETIAMFFTDRETFLDVGADIGQLLTRSPLTWSRLAGARLLHARVLHARSALRTAMAGADWVAVGDSAAPHDPLSGRGIFNAFRHGLAAAEAVHALLAGQSGALALYGGRVRRDFAAYAALRRTHYARETRWSEAGFWRRRTASGA